MSEQQHDLFEHQPDWCRKPLLPKELDADNYIKRVLTYDPTPIYEQFRHRINPFNRYNWQNINFAEMFPKREDGLCACGCGKPRKGSMWASTECMMFAIGVWNVIGGRQDFINLCLKSYYGHSKCARCNEKEWKEFDHIHAVSKGGGGCWLSNFQGLCKGCHTAKTREDFGWKKLKTSKNYD